MILRRFLLLALVAYCASLAAQEIHDAPKDCPPTGDGYQWMPYRGHATGKVMWVQTKTQQEFEKLCGGFTACAWRFEELTIIVTQSPAYVYGPTFRQHEECHDAWDHEAVRMYGPGLAR